LREFVKNDIFPKGLMPKTPQNYYKNKGWISWGDFLNTGKIAHYKKSYMSFEDAKNFVRKLCLKSSSEYRKYCLGEYELLPKKPSDLPVAVSEIYKENGWRGFQDFLGYDKPRKSPIQIWPKYEEAKQLISEFSINSNKEWRLFAKLEKFPNEIPRSPDKVYSRTNEWKGWTDFLGKSEKI
jgi:hypothetical protein